MNKFLSILAAALAVVFLATGCNNDDGSTEELTDLAKEVEGSYVTNVNVVKTPGGTVASGLLCEIELKKVSERTVSFTHTTLSFDGKNVNVKANIILSGRTGMLQGRAQGTFTTSSSTTTYGYLLEASFINRKNELNVPYVDLQMRMRIFDNVNGNADSPLYTLNFGGQEGAIDDLAEIAVGMYPVKLQVSHPEYGTACDLIEVEIRKADKNLVHMVADDIRLWDLDPMKIAIMDIELSGSQNSANLASNTTLLLPGQIMYRPVSLRGTLGVGVITLDISIASLGITATAYGSEHNTELVNAAIGTYSSNDISVYVNGVRSSSSQTSFAVTGSSYDKVNVNAGIIYTDNYTFDMLARSVNLSGTPRDLTLELTPSTTKDDEGNDKLESNFNVSYRGTQTKANLEVSGNIIDFVGVQLQFTISVENGDVIEIFISKDYTPPVLGLVSEIVGTYDCLFNVSGDESYEQGTATFKAAINSKVDLKLEGFRFMQSSAVINIKGITLSGESGDIRLNYSDVTSVEITSGVLSFDGALTGSYTDKSDLDLTLTLTNSEQEFIISIRSAESPN